MFGVLVRPFDLTGCSGHDTRRSCHHRYRPSFCTWSVIISFFLDFSRKNFSHTEKMKRRDAGEKRCEIGEEETVKDERPKRKSRRQQKMHRMHFSANEFSYSYMLSFLRRLIFILFYFDARSFCSANKVPLRFSPLALLQIVTTIFTKKKIK